MQRLEFFILLLLMIKRIVLTGAPGTGKTSIINKLEAKYSCHQEISREIISQQLANGGEITPWNNLFDFSDLVIKKRLKQYKSCSSGLYFFDRSILDSIAYLQFGQTEIHPDWLKIAETNRYHKNVFITPPWKEIYHTDNERKESFQEAHKIHNQLKETYRNYNYNLIEVPCTNINERIEFIIKHIDQD